MHLVLQNELSSSTLDKVVVRISQPRHIKKLKRFYGITTLKDIACLKLLCLLGFEVHPQRRAYFHPDGMISL